MRPDPVILGLELGVGEEPGLVAEDPLAQPPDVVRQGAVADDEFQDGLMPIVRRMSERFGKIHVISSGKRRVAAFGLP